MIARADMDLSDVLDLAFSFKRETREMLHETVKDVCQQFQVRERADRLSSKGDASVNSRQLRKALWTDQKSIPNGVEGRVFFRGHWDKVAGLHEYGTKGRGGSLPDIVPKRVNWLTLPFPGAYKGQSRGKALRALRQVNTFVRGYRKGGAPFIKPKGQRGLKGADYLVQFRKGAKGAKPEPTFLMVKKTKHPPRLHFFSDWDRWAGRKSGPGWKIINAGCDRLAKRMTSMGRR